MSSLHNKRARISVLFVVAVLLVAMLNVGSALVAHAQELDLTPAQLTAQAEDTSGSDTVVVESDVVSLEAQATKTPITDAEVVAESRNYTGSPLTTKVRVKLAGKTLVEGRDFTVEYFDSVEVGSALILVKGTGNYNGSTYAYFEIEKAPLTGASFSLSSRSFVYDGTEKVPVVSVRMGNKTLTARQDYTLSVSDKIGDPFQDTTVTLTVNGKGNYTGTLKTTYIIRKNPEIVRKSITLATVSSIPQQDWTGRAITPTPTLSYEGQTLVLGTDYTLSYKNNVNPGTATVVITGIGKYFKDSREVSFTIYKKPETPTPTPGGGSTGGGTTGGGSSSGGTSTKPKTEGQKMFRLYNPNSGEHFYTASFAEDVALVRAGWRYEGIAWTAPKTSNTPVYRLYNKNAGDHHYTTSKGERDMLVKVGWRYEGIGWYSDDAKGVALYRQYNPNARAGSHNYTTSKAERNMLIGVGWKDEGIAWYGLK